MRYTGVYRVRSRTYTCVYRDTQREVGLINYLTYVARFRVSLLIIGAIKL